MFSALFVTVKVVTLRMIAVATKMDPMPYGAIFAKLMGTRLKNAGTRRVNPLMQPSSALLMNPTRRSRFDCLKRKRYNSSNLCNFIRILPHCWIYRNIHVAVSFDVYTTHTSNNFQYCHDMLQHFTWQVQALQLHQRGKTPLDPD